MIPKKIHLCWFSNDPYPVEIKVCIESWKRILPDYEIRIWGMKDARAIGIDFINEALDQCRWAFASDVVRFYAVYTEGGVYMDSDIFLFRRFDKFISEDKLVTFNECVESGRRNFGLQAAFFMGPKGNEFCRKMIEYYRSRHYINPDGTQDNLISPLTMKAIAEQYGYVCNDSIVQNLDVINVYPTHFLAPRKRYKIDSETIGQHRVYGSWRKRKFGRRIEIAINHLINVIKYSVGIRR